jgi:signal transduction histidine kinase
MNDALEVIEDRVVLSKLKLKVNYSPTAAMVLLDREKMRIVFLNLLVNAIESMGEIKGMIAVSVMHKPDFHEVKIEDTGCGMSEDTIQKMFDPYFTTKPNGLGLGLATTYAIIVSHKATIDVESRINVGTVFTLAFPAL